MNKDWIVKGSILTAALIVTGAASAQAPAEPALPAPPGEQVAPTFESVDVNQDSLISEQEATTARAMTPEAFASADANQDGYLTREEF